MEKTRIRFDDLKEGDELPPLSVGPLEKKQFAEYGAAAYDANPIHTDDDFARAAGYPSVFAQGMLSMGFLGRFLVEHCGVGNLRHFRVRFSKITWPGEVITCRAVVTKKYEQGGEKVVECAIHTENQEGERKVEGTAVFVLP